MISRAPKPSPRRAPLQRATPLELQLESLERRTLLAISIFAAGATGEESIALQVDGTTVRTWTELDGDYVNGTYETLTYDVDGIAPNRLRIVFLNDGVTSSGADRNVRVDRLEVDGLVIQTESSEVFSQGSWDTASGCGAGFKQSELLHCSNAYFDFSNISGGGSNIVIEAAGATNEEQMELLIDDQVVATWNNIGGSYSNSVFVPYTYQSTEVISPDRVKVAFTNDGTTGSGEDRNLRVDHVRIDGVIYESESPSVFSTGTWDPADGCAAGFKASDALHCGGYFHYAQDNTLTILAAGSTGTERVELLIDGIVVAGWDNVGGDFNNGVYESLSYQSATAISADQVRVAFVNDGNDASGNDRNVRIDGILINGVKFESEADTVYSTGTWRSSDGCDPGFKASDNLHCDGFFQFANPPANPGVISLATSVYSVNEADGSVDVIIERTQGSDGMATVDYRTVDADATSNLDFIPVSGRVLFLDGETSKTITIGILQDALQEGDETFSFTIDNPGGPATLLFPRTAIITIEDDESDPGLGGFQFDAATFDGALFLDLNGDASVQSGQLHLTQANPFEAGSAFYGQAIEIDADTALITSFQFQLTGGNGTGGADGFTFVLHNAVAGSGLLGTAGGGLGYGGTGSSSLAIEFDTYDNGGDDLNANHVALLQDGQSTPLVSANAPVDLNDGAVGYAWIEYDGSLNQLDVYVSAGASQPTTPTLSYSVDLAAALGGQAYFGFTAATGGLANRHQINSWSFESSTELIALPTTFSPETLELGLLKPIAIDWTPDGRNMYIATQGGVVLVRRDGQLLATPTIDISDHVNGVRDRGLMDIAIHPDLVNHPYLYLLYTYDPPQVNSYTGLAGPDGRGNRASRLTRVTLDPATDYTTMAPNTSEVVLLGTNSTWNNFNGFANSTNDFSEPPAGILPDGSNLEDFLAADSESHTVGSVEFGPDGNLYVSNGDGTSYNQMDPRTVRVQDIDNLSGKILRIDPLSGEGLPNNPFYNGDADANRSKVYQYGLRNPFRITVGATGQVYVGDVGWTTWEEVNAGQPGDNFGWPYYEGGNNGVNLRTRDYEDLPEAQAFYNSGEPVTAAIVALNHGIDGINAIIVGDIYTGTAYPSQYQGDLLFNDLGQGIVRNVSFDASGNVSSVSTFTTGAQSVVQIKNGPDGHLYYVNLFGGTVGRWIPDAVNQGSAAPRLEPGGNTPPILEGVSTGARWIRINAKANGPVIVNLAERIIATEDGHLSISDDIRRIIATGRRGGDDAISVVGNATDDRVRIRPGMLHLVNDSVRVIARRYEQVIVDGHDGDNSVRLTGSRGDDRLEARPGEASLRGISYATTALRFQAVEAIAGRGGHDEAILHDSSGDDLLRAGARSLELSGEGYHHVAIGFTQTITTSSGGHDVAIWHDRFRDSQFMAGDLYAALVGRKIAHELRGWWRVYVDSHQIEPSV